MSLLGKRLLLAAGATLLAALLGWVVLAHAARRPQQGATFPPFHAGSEDPILGCVLQPGFHGRHQTENFDVDVRTNAFGQRGGPRELARPPGVRRVVLVGDSFSFGWGVEEEQTFAARLAGLLADAGRPVEMIDAGVPGWNAANEYLWLARSGLDFQPDLVLLQLCDNDLADFTWFEFDLDARNLPVAIRTRPRLTESERRALLTRAASREGETLAQLQADHTQAELNAIVASGLWRQADERRAAAGAPPEGPIASLSADEVRRGLDTGEAFQARYLGYLVAAIGELCAARGVPLRLLLVKLKMPGDAGGQAALATLCAEMGGHCLSSEAFIPRADVSEVFFSRDPHWMPEGHRRAAEALATWLLRDPELHLAPP